ncbi:MULTISPECIES: sucrose-6-phosphate hydrolase [unclassified Streptococcus]|uniref:sucrose-6-phosphate hydrolase n=1 Tax=unclassified Streptococcus TaxID=2608887 RepID=UPI001072498B|nr:MULTISPECIES: sucrose-6-phosphate hydrolase [unclassified Streptococcus]MBF0806267.1 sucrose-6-phosphate hydrolase [Streptococcus sp. 19428wA2_WM07]TFU28145.1 sucrose-6-phosphate hydrolase [Streptococcus sp. WM07]
MKWTTENRYKRYEDWTAEEYQKLQDLNAQSPWHNHYHVEPATGLLNDPNGFSYFDGKWILFYQNFPFGAAHGLKQWVQLESDDLVNFKETGLKLLPDTPLDSHGAYSGSALQVEDKLFLFYTGNVRNKQWIRHPYQIGALVHKDGTLEKMEQVLIDQPEDATDHFRDPQIFQFEGEYYAIVGGQDLDKKGFVRLYKAENKDIRNWQSVGDLDFANDRTAYMMECPNLVFINQQPVLLYCPQGLDKNIFDYQNIYPNLYKIGQSFDTTTATMVEVGPLMQLDYGFETYATQGFNAPDGTAYAISWMGLPDVGYPSDAFEHQGCMSLVKKLSIKDGKLYQEPVETMKNLRQAPEAWADRVETDNSYELTLSVPAGQDANLVLFANADKEGLNIQIDREAGRLTVDRSGLAHRFDLEHGESRDLELPAGETKLQIFIDQSTFEIFINDGEFVLSGRAFPSQDQTGCYLTNGQVTGHYYPLSANGR